MIIAHLPSGYLLGTMVTSRMQHAGGTSTLVVRTAMASAIAPDIDMLYFYLIDHRQTHHHKYFTHWPILLFLMLVTSLFWVRNSDKSILPYLYLIFSMAGVLHLLLDSVVGDIWWFAPIYNKPYALITVSAMHNPWWLNFLYHWSFGLELILCLLALLVLKSRNNANQCPKN